MMNTNGTADWRKTVNINSRKTYMVIGLFFLIYLCLGLLIDVDMGARDYPRATISQIFHALITFQITPIATIILLIVAFFSLVITYKAHDKIMLLGTEYREVFGDSPNLADRQLYNTVEEVKIAAGLSFMPKVFIIEAEYMNAFASGYSEKSAMVAITQGLRDKLNRSELQAVMAHELSHIRNMDIKLTLTATVLANLIIMVIDMMFYRSLNRRNSKSNGLDIIIILLRYILSFVTILLIFYLSRTREYMADAGAVQLLRDNQPLASALIKISSDHEENKQEYSKSYAETPHENIRKEAYIFNPAQAGISGAFDSLFSTHPSLQNRLKALGISRKE